MKSAAGRGRLAALVQSGERSARREEGASPDGGFWHAAISAGDHLRFDGSPR